MRTSLILLVFTGASCSTTHHVMLDHDVTVTPEPEPTIESFFTPPPPGVTINRPPPFWPPHEHIIPVDSQGELPWAPTIN